MTVLDPGAIDVHAHFLPPRYRESALAHGEDHPDGMPALPEWNLDDALRTMDEVGIRAAALSISSPGVAFVPDPIERAALADAVNRDGAEVVAAHPDRFGLMACLPLPDVDAALASIAHAYDDLGADGIGLLTNANGQYLGEPSLEPVLAALDERNAVVTIHPTSPCGWEQLSFGRPRPLLEFLLDTTRAVVNLALTGSLARYPRIRWVVPHAGAALPLLADRVETLAAWVVGADVDIVGALGGLHYDLAGIPLPRALPALLSLTDESRLLYGSDYPFTPTPRVRELAEALAGAEVLDGSREAAFRDNALRLFPRWA